MKFCFRQFCLNALNRLLLGAVVLLFCVQVTIGQGLGALSFGSDDTFDVATWNLEAFPKDGQTTVDSVRKAITALEFDVLGLQEINDTTALRQMVEQMPGYSAFIAEGYYAGLAYIYKSDAVEIQSFYKIYTAFPYWDIFPRAPVVMELNFQGESLVVINNHLKCCGDGELDLDDEMDEENRRYQASILLKEYVDNNLPNAKVCVIGDLNDLLTDPPSDNVFQEFLDDSDQYLFADLAIAQGTSNNWSYPLWPSHLDHLLITDELFADFANPNSSVQTIKIDDFMSGGLWEYDEIISDHRPVALKIDFDPLTAISATPEERQPKIFPNPTVGAITIEFERVHAYTRVECFNANGQLIQTQELNTVSLVKMQLDAPPGLYTISITAPDHVSRQRIVKY